MPHGWTFAAVLASIGVAACAAPPSSAQSELPVLVKLAQPADDASSIARRASEVAGVPVRYVAASGPPWHALALQCGDASACDAALAKLRADTRTYSAVERDERKRIVTP
jgi:hypothetical protein